MSVEEMLRCVLSRWRDAIECGEGCPACGADWVESSPGSEYLAHQGGCPVLAVEAHVGGGKQLDVVIEDEDPYPDAWSPLYRVEWDGWVMHMCWEGNAEVFADARVVVS